MLPAAAAAAATVAGAAGGTSAGNTDALVRLEGVCCICVPRAKFSFACISSCMACEKPCNVISSLVFLPPLFAKWHPSQHQGYLCKHTPVLPALVPAAMACQFRLSQFGHFIVHVIPLLCDLLCFFLYLCAQILIHVRFFLHDL